MTLTLPNTIVSNQSLFQWHQKCRQYMLSINDQFDTSHRIDHIDRVLQNALEIQDQHPSDINIILPAVMLHDCIPIDKRSPKRSQASTLSAQHATKLLKDWNYPTKYHAAIADAIASHSFSAGIPAHTIEAKIVQDADRLDSLGAIGTARCFMLGGKFDNQLYHENDPTAEHRTLDDSLYTLDHFYVKLLQLHQTFLTTAGKEIAQARTQFMRNFIKTLLAEARSPNTSFTL